MSTKDDSKQLMHDLQAVISDAEILLKNSATPLGDDFKSAKERFETTLKNAKEEVVRIEKLLVHKGKEAVQATDTFVKDHPWQAVGLSTAIGLVIGLLISRK